MSLRLTTQNESECRSIAPRARRGTGRDLVWCVRARLEDDPGGHQAPHIVAPARAGARWGNSHKKTLAELKGDFALDVVPTAHYGANSAWQPLSVLAYNLARSFQLDTLATPKPRSRKRTYAYLCRSIQTLRFLLIARSGRLPRIGGRHVLRLAQNPATETLYGSVTQRLAA